MAIENNKNQPDKGFRCVCECMCSFFSSKSDLETGYLYFFPHVTSEKEKKKIRK